MVRTILSLGVALVAVSAHESATAAGGGGTAGNLRRGAMESNVPDVFDEIHRQRYLQSTTRLWDISTPAMSYSGLELDMVYTVRNQVRTSDVRIHLFRDQQCTLPITDVGNYTKYLAVDVTNDLTAFGDGSGTRQVRGEIIRQSGIPTASYPVQLTTPSAYLP
jgi:hypothetical protein